MPSVLAAEDAKEQAEREGREFTESDWDRIKQTWIQGALEEAIKIVAEVKKMSKTSYFEPPQHFYQSIAASCIDQEEHQSNDCNLPPLAAPHQITLSWLLYLCIKCKDDLNYSKFLNDIQYQDIYMLLKDIVDESTEENEQSIKCQYVLILLEKSEIIQFSSYRRTTTSLLYGYLFNDDSPQTQQRIIDLSNRIADNRAEQSKEEGGQLLVLYYFFETILEIIECQPQQQVNFTFKSEIIVNALINRFASYLENQPIHQDNMIYKISFSAIRLIDPIHFRNLSSRIFNILLKRLLKSKENDQIPKIFMDACRLVGIKYYKQYYLAFMNYFKSMGGGGGGVEEQGNLAKIILNGPCHSDLSIYYPWLLKPILILVRDNDSYRHYFFDYLVRTNKFCLKDMHPYLNHLVTPLCQVDIRVAPYSSLMTRLLKVTVSRPEGLTRLQIQELFMRFAKSIFLSNDLYHQKKLELKEMISVLKLSTIDRDDCCLSANQAIDLMQLWTIRFDQLIQTKWLSLAEKLSRLPAANNVFLEGVTAMFPNQDKKLSESHLLLVDIVSTNKQVLLPLALDYTFTSTMKHAQDILEMRSSTVTSYTFETILLKLKFIIDNTNNNNNYSMLNYQNNYNQNNNSIDSYHNPIQIPVTFKNDLENNCPIFFDIKN
ncbi:hypothetical protein DFA_00427 [Cavenderia fasciculata]|uniref:Uncharacterized protein n=1 Tax=Cavenderia fasciculata TaxID=261658 RepID=F4PRR7_CACFS|nr:uncharacterized protein DFA_00427 [Cavenderia fasciculata]EGG20566.1 hypothetical protein DFA_00427 [Cavenderia fasciculata]|eukprot:XP_004358416.1 hypothetical protein DFA_00427 [Cavenderia fasciculata]